VKKKVLIFGPIGDAGGRDVEVNIIARSLEREYDIRIFSTIYITLQSVAIQGLDKPDFSSLQMELFRNPLIGLLSFIKFLSEQKKNQAYRYVRNRFSRSLFNFRKQEIAIVKKEIAQADIVIACVQLSSLYLREAAEFANEKNIPFLVRTTGTIREIPKKDFDFLKKVSRFIHHSKANAENMDRQISLPYSIIDQCALSEKSLLALPIRLKKNIVFGFAGRLSQEKGILPLIDFFISHPELKLVVAGDGLQRAEMADKIVNSPNVNAIGHIHAENISAFFEQIDCLIIPSLEESGPLVGLEAMAAGKTIISAKVGAMMERLAGTKNDFWFSINNPQSLATAIDDLQMLPGEERRQISLEVRRKYQEKYRLESIENQYLQLLKKTFRMRAGKTAKIELFP
jgi:glycosyltransferase involved in cell wall biosynthesis